jgi:hypothetical protein
MGGTLKHQVHLMVSPVMQAQRRLNLMGFVADDTADLLGLKSLGRINHMKQHGQTAHGLQHFGQRRPHARAFASG